MVCIAQMSRLTEAPGAREFVQLSDYAAEALRRWRLEPEWFETDQPIHDRTLAVDAQIRRKRQLGALRTIWCELQGVHDVEETGIALSALAQDCTEQALQEAERIIADRFGSINDSEGHPARLCVMALGKLGGNELNFNSDLDLVFVHDVDGRSDGRRSLEATDYFGRVVVELTRLLEATTAQGRAWVIDTRLRPFGQSGSMVWSLGSMERYFVNEGREWERYAWLKARPIAGDIRTGQGLLQLLQPFVFRRYLDYGLFESLRNLHQRIDLKSRRDDLAADIKRGAGGIRELEFVVQSMQLLRGGREPSLRISGFLPALRTARQLRLIEADSAIDLEHHYRYLRQLENGLQAVSGRQTHRLPASPDFQQRLARWMGRSDWDELDRMTDSIRQDVARIFHASFDSHAGEHVPDHGLWPAKDLEAKLSQLGFADPSASATRLEQLAERLERREQSAEGRRRLDRLMPVFLDQVLQHELPDCGLDDMLTLIETISRRSAYLALLYERPSTLDRMVSVFRQSGRVARWVIDNPNLLDDLLDPINGYALPELSIDSEQDFESGMLALARYRQAGFVRTALGQLDHSLDRRSARTQLSHVAEAVVGATLDLVLQKEQPRPAIIGYGNLGARSLHYDSDLDLVFLHHDDSMPLRPIQRLISAMQLPQVGGRLYEIDTRLRPNGRSGMLVSTFDGFADYQQHKAWLWEHQSLIRARCIDGGCDDQKAFEAIRRRALCKDRDPNETRQSLQTMRRQQQQGRHEMPEKKLLNDIQFIAELGVLLNARKEPELINHRATDDQLEQLAEIGWLCQDDANRLLAIQGEAIEIRDWHYLKRGYDQVPDAKSVADCERLWSQLFDDA